MNPVPAGWPRMSASLYCEDPHRAIEWMVSAMGFTVRLKIDGEDGKLMHSELTFGDAVVMVSGAGPSAREGRTYATSPRTNGGRVSGALMLYVDDVEAHCARARAAGGTIAQEPSTQDYGDEYWVDRSYELVDPEGHRWWISQRLKTQGK
ncbi:MAG: VOC family protein [Deltaproteobacteria bacterium]|nr:VOC family protein [Deltaproteobacteria bacterium]